MGLRLRDIRQQRGVSIAALSERTGVSQTHIANVEHGAKSISLDALVSIVLVLDVSLDFIVLGIHDVRQARGVYLRSDDELNVAYVALGDAAQ